MLDKLFLLLSGDSSDFKNKKHMANCAGIGILAILLFFVHLTLAVYYIIIGLNIMIYLNLFSLLIYAFVVIINKKHKGSISSFLIIAEICIYSIISTYLIGWDSGTQWYLPIATMPCYAFFSIQKKSIAIYITLISLSMAACYFIYYHYEPLYKINVNFILTFNIFITMVCPYLVNKCSEIGNILTENYYTEKIKTLINDANKDPLTKLWNRRYALAKLDELSFGKNSLEHFCLAFVDIDFFKNINDTFGHSVGDKVLESLSYNILNSFRDTDIPIRWGGEEFLLILTNAKEQYMFRVLDTFRSQIAASPIKLEDKDVYITITIGYSFYRSGISVFDTINNSDKALYYGKNNGRNCVINYEDIQHNIS